MTHSRSSNAVTSDAARSDGAVTATHAGESSDAAILDGTPADTPTPAGESSDAAIPDSAACIAEASVLETGPQLNDANEGIQIK